MKRRRPSLWLYLLDSYSYATVIYLFLRFIAGSRWWWMGFFNTFALWLFLPLLPLLLIHLLFRRRRSSFLTLLLFIYGMAQFAPLQAGLFTSSDKEQDLRVLTFNIWNKNTDIEGSVSWVLEQDADIIILQEMVEKNLPHLPRLLEAYPYYEYVTGNVRVLSRYPFIESGLVYLEEPSGSLPGRLAVHAVVDVKGRAVTVYGVHLSVPAGNRETLRVGSAPGFLYPILNYDETRRNNQIRNLIGRVQAETNPVIIAGDFNTSHSSPILDELALSGMRDSFRSAGTGWGMTWSHNPPALPLIRIDYVWYSQGLSPLRMTVGEFIGSDHLPLVVDFSFTQP